MNFQIPEFEIDVDKLFEQARYLFVSAVGLTIFSNILVFGANMLLGETTWLAVGIMLGALYAFYIQMPYFVLAGYANISVKRYSRASLWALRAVELACFVAVFVPFWAYLKHSGVSSDDKATLFLVHMLLSWASWLVVLFMLMEKKFTVKNCG